MDPSQQPTFHLVPGAPGALGYPSHFGFTQPPLMIPAEFLTELIKALRCELVSQNQILMEQFELKLESIQKGLAEHHHCCTGAADCGELQEEPMESPPAAVLDDPESPLDFSGDNSNTEDQFFGGSTPASPPTISAEDIPTTPITNPSPQDSPPFNTPSSPTQMSTPCSQDQEEPEIETPLSHLKSQKRKRALHEHGTLKRPYRGKKSYPPETQDVSYEVQQSERTYAVWPPLTEDSAISQKYIGCDKCATWFHFGCVGLKVDHEDGSPWECPLCVQYPTRDAANIPRESNEMCARPGCPNPKGQEYFMDQLLGRCYVPKQDIVKYLVAYEGYPLNQCTWEPPTNFSNDKIKEFLEQWAAENPSIDVESLDPHETILLHDAQTLDWMGITWPGAD